jgi:hypothetical protein
MSTRPKRVAASRAMTTMRNQIEEINNYEATHMTYNPYTMRRTINPIELDELDYTFFYNSTDVCLYTLENRSRKKIKLER